MKIIGQYEIDEIEKVFNGIHDLKNYKVDRELYAHFLYEIYEKSFWNYVQNVDLNLANEYFSLKSGNDSYKIIHIRSEAKQKYSKKFHEFRDKFYLVNGETYSYTYLGEMNVGHVIEIKEYESQDIIRLLNALITDNNELRNRNLFQRILNK